jgi:RpiB/LacA/LacB family sugar-phosphate isomerase
VHQVNLEYLARVVFVDEEHGLAYPDTLVGTDSHTTMINGLGVLGWGVGGIEAEAAMLGQPMSMLIPRVLGFRLRGELREGATATDLVLTVTERLRQKGVVGQFVEFYGPGVSALPLADRATIGNMSPEFGSTCAIFPIDAETLRYLEFSGRPQELIDLVEAYAKEQGLWHDEHAEEPTFSDTIELDLGEVEPSLAGPKRPQDRVPLATSQVEFREALQAYLPDGGGDDPKAATQPDEGSSLSFPASDPPSSTEPVDGDGPRAANGEPARRAHAAEGGGSREDWAWASEAAAREVAGGRAAQGIVCCWTGTGASIAANKVPGVRAALCTDAVTAAGARRWNDANVLALSLRSTSQAELVEILDAWFATASSDDPDDAANIAHVDEIAG